MKRKFITFLIPLLLSVVIAMPVCAEEDDPLVGSIPAEECMIIDTLDAAELADAYQNLSTDSDAFTLTTADGEDELTGATTVDTLPTETEVQTILLSKKSKYPEGTYWGSSTQGDAGGKYNPFKYYTGYACAAFATEMQDYAFGTLPFYPHYDYTFDDIRIGDILRVNYDSHSVIVIDKDDDYITIAEGNYNSSVHWGRKLSRSYISSYLTYVWTRWPKGSVTSDGVAYCDNSDGTVSITGYYGHPESGLIIFPETINGKKVTRIDDYVFYYSTSTDNIYIPDTVTEVGEYAFYWNICRRLMFGKGIEKLGAHSVEYAVVQQCKPEKAGYTFDKWVTDSGDEFQFNTYDTQPSALHATWKTGSSAPISHVTTVSYQTVNSDGKTVYNRYMIPFKKGSTQTISITGMKSGFSGWEIWGDVTVNEATDTTVDLTIGDSNAAVIAHYNESGYKIIKKTSSGDTSGTDTGTGGTGNGTDTGTGGTGNGTDTGTGGTGNGTDTNTKTNFTDVSSGKYYAPAVNWAVSKGITNGTSSTTFSPDDTCNRAQVVTFLWRSVGSPTPSSYTCPFTDISSGAYYYNAVLWAYQNGITTGKTASTFGPGDPVTRGQFVTFLYRSKGGSAYSISNPFTDIQAGKFYYYPVLWAYYNSITTGKGNGIFDPEGICTRAEVVTFIYRAKNL